MQPRWNRQATPVSYWEICQTPVLQGKQYGFGSSDPQSQRKAWIDSVLFEKWVQKIDWKMKAANRHILLFMDNCTAYMSDTGLRNMQLIFFLPNCTSKLKPASRGIIQNLKVHYRQAMMMWFFFSLVGRGYWKNFLFVYKINLSGNSSSRLQKRNIHTFILLYLTLHLRRLMFTCLDASSINKTLLLALCNGYKIYHKLLFIVTTRMFTLWTMACAVMILS